MLLLVHGHAGQNKHSQISDKTHLPREAEHEHRQAQRHQEFYRRRVHPLSVQVDFVHGCGRALERESHHYTRMVPVS